jgi:hypothetical protein
MATTKTQTSKTTTTKAAPKKATPKVAPKATAPKAKSYNYMGFPGLAMTSLNRATGSQISIWFNAEGGPMKGNTAAYCVECETHGTKKACATRSEARDFRMDPTGFCAKCKAAAKKGGEKAAPAKTAAKKVSPKKAA